ncbi:hypothetical protein NQZ68_022667 [Dissostichus eleginoides]|nr:hypothetical protein NQZ68_022667 [Dissostichus eleginoides]
MATNDHIFTAFAERSGRNVLHNNKENVSSVGGGEKVKEVKNRPSVCSAPHLLPLFICCSNEAGRMEEEEEEEGGLHVFLPGSATLSPACRGEEEGGRQRGELEM